MNDKETEQVKAMYQYYKSLCFVCTDLSTQRSHIIGNTLPNRKLYGIRIIQNPLNWLPACCLDHNSLIDIGKNKILASKIVSIIDSLMDERDKRTEIESLVRANIQRKRDKSDL